jgi:hypothetical protein
LFVRTLSNKAADLISKIYDVINQGSRMEDWNILCLVHKHICLVHKHMEDWNILNLFGLVMVQLLWNLNLKALDLFYQVRLKITYITMESSDHQIFNNEKNVNLKILL